MADEAEDDVLDTLDDLLWLIHEMPPHEDMPAFWTLDELLDDCGDRAIRCDPGRLAELLAEGQAVGLIDIYEVGEGAAAYATLTPLAAERLGVKLTIDSARWIEAEKEFDERYKKPPGEVELPELDEDAASGYAPGDEHRPAAWARPPVSLWTDPTTPEPIDVLIDMEFIEAYGTLLGPCERRLRDGSKVVVRQVFGLGVPWPQALADEVVVVKGDGFALVRTYCRGCGREKAPKVNLPRNAYCTVCDRSGVDGKLPPIEKELLKPDPQKTKYEPGDLKGGTGTNPRKPVRASA